MGVGCGGRMTADETAGKTFMRDVRNRAGVPHLFVMGLALAIVAFDLLDGTNYLGDIDDVLRASQVKQLLAGGSWFDRTLPMIAMPEPYVSPWSRLVDLPYLVIALALSPLTGGDAALQIAFHVWPPVMLAAYCFLVVEVIKGLLPLGQMLGRSALVVTIMTMILPLWEFAPGRIDHHNMQLLLFMLLFWGVTRWTGRGAVAAGIAAVLSVAVGLELLPLVALVLGAVSICWILDRPGSQFFLLGFGLTIAVVAPLAGLVLLGPRDMAGTACDAFSAPYIAALAGYGLISAGAAGVTRQASVFIRFSALALAGVGLIGLLAYQFPLCLSGPYHMVDPISRSLWLDRVDQEKSILSFFEIGYFPHLAMLGALCLILLLAVPAVMAGWRERRSGIAVVFMVAAVSMALAFVQTRYIRFPTAFVPLFVPLALLFLSRRSVTGLRVIALAGTALAAVGVVLHLALPVKPRTYDVVDYMSADTCKNPDTSGLSTIPPGRIMAPASLGLFAAGTLPPGMSVAAISFHRASPGMRRMFEAFVLTETAARRAALEPFDYLAVCRLAVPSDVPSTHLYAAVARGEGWPGLVPVAEATRGDFLVFRIDHAALR